MPLNSSGPLSIGGSTVGQSINLEFGRAATAQTSMSQLYRGGGIVPNAPSNNAIATAGAISLSQFYGATNRVQVNITISSNQTNYILNTAKAAGYVAGITDVTVTINSGVYVSSSSTGTYALDVDTSWAAGDTVTIVNNGFIIGMGGAGGAGAGRSNTGVNSAGSGGTSGGPALSVRVQVSIKNYGTIAGGGGGGGGGRCTYIGYTPRAGGGGGGGRTGATNTAGGAGGVASGAGFSGAAGGTGTSSSEGWGGAGGFIAASEKGGAGGNGGGYGAAGATGSVGAGGTAGLGPYSGGSGGAAVNGNTNITWVATGTRLGAIS